MLKTDIKALSSKDQEALLKNLKIDYVQEKIILTKAYMRQDMWFGPIWFVGYSISLFTTHFSAITQSIFFLGLIFFVYSITKRGSYGSNKRRLKVYEEVLQELQN